MTTQLLPPLTTGGSATAAITAITPVVWGTTYVVTTELLPAGHPLFAGLVRALPAGLIALAVARQLPTGVWWWRSLVLGTLNIGLFFPLLFLSAQHLPGGVAATFGAVQPLIVAALAVAVLGEPLTPWRLAWGVAGLLGVGLVVLGPDAALDPLGVAAGLAGAASMALGVTLTKRWGRPVHLSPVGFAGWQLTAGGLVLIPLAMLEGPPPAIDGSAAAGFTWLCLIGGLAAYVLWFRGIGALPVASVAMLGLLSPLVAAGLGAALLGQLLSPLQLLGFAVSLSAIVGSQLPAPSRTTHELTPHEELLTKGCTS